MEMVKIAEKELTTAVSLKKTRERDIIFRFPVPGTKIRWVWDGDSEHMGPDAQELRRCFVLLYLCHVNQGQSCSSTLLRIICLIN
jgi:hypothetical protein